MAVRIDEAGLRALFPEIDRIEDQALRRGVVAIWLEVAAECAWERFGDIPKNLEAERGRRLTDYIRGVTRMPPESCSGSFAAASSSPSAPSARPGSPPTA